MRNLIDLTTKIEKFAIDNSPVIMTALGVSGVISSVILTADATFKAAEIISREDPEPGFETFKLVWPYYIPPVGTAVLTISAIIISHQISTRRMAALASAYSISEKAFTEYREKIVDRLGAKKEQAVQDEIAQERMNQNPKGDREIIVSSGDVMCYDEFSGRYFTSSVEKIRQAQNDVNFKLINDNYCSLSDFYSKIGLATTSMSEEVGWNLDRQMEIRFSTTLSDDGRPCVSIDFNKAPIREYYRIW